MKTLYFAAFGLSPTLEAGLVGVQRRILAETGAASALALPPVIPLAFLSRPPSARRAGGLGAEKLTPLAFTGYGIKAGVLHLGIEPFEAVELLRESFADEEPPVFGDLFPLPPGVYLAAEASDEGLLARLPPPPAARIKVGRFLVFRLTVEDGEAWWKGVEGTLMEERWLKTQPRPARTT